MEMKTIPMSTIVNHFKTLPPETIRSQTYLQYTDSQLLDAADEFLPKDGQRYVAILETLLHSPEHSVDLLDYGNVYLEVIGTIVPFRGVRDNAATCYAWFGYGVQHNYPYDIFESARVLVLEYMSRGEVDALETGLRILVRFSRAFFPVLGWAASTLGYLNEQPSTVELGNRIFDLLLNRARENHWDEAIEVLSKYVEIDADVSQKNLDVDPDLVDEVVDVVSKLLIDEPQPGWVTFTVQPSLAALLSPESAKNEAPPQPEEAVLELIYLALSPTTMDHAPEADQALRVLQQWFRDETLPLQELAPWLEKAQGDWHAFLSNKMCKVGFLTPEELKELATNPGVSVFLRGDAVETLVDLALRNPALEPDVKTFIRYLLTRPESRENAEEEMFLSLIISDLLDTDWLVLLPEIEAAFRDDAVAPDMVRPDDVLDAWDVSLDVPSVMPPREGGEYILLRCTNCGRERYHFVHKVLLDLETFDQQAKGFPVKYDPFIMDHEIVCPKCGARDAYEVSDLYTTKLFALAFPDLEPSTDTEDEDDLLTALLIKAVHSSESELEVYPLRTGTRDGKAIHPLALRDRYLQNIKKNPTDPANYVALANIYKNIFRENEALSMARKAHDLAPQNLNIILLRAMAEHDAGDRQMARQLYGQVIENVVRTRWGWWRDDYDLAATAREGLQALKRGKPSPWAEGARESVLANSGAQQRRKGGRRKKKRRKKKRR